jgi:uncharacterized protein (DUF488 family)
MPPGPSCERRDASVCGWVYPWGVMAPLTIWTVGHSNHSPESFVQLLARYEIEFVADVRSYPYSRFAPHFNREILRADLRRQGIRYVFFGEELGGRPSADEHYDEEGHALYGPMSQEPRFVEAIGRLLIGARKHRIALMCSEASEQACHRRLLVGKVLTEHGAELRHILADGTIRAERDVSIDAASQSSLFEEGSAAWRSTQSVSHRRRLNTSSAV